MGSEHAPLSPAQLQQRRSQFLRGRVLLAAMLLASGVLLMWSPLSTLYHVAGLLLLAGVIVWQTRFQAA